MNDDLLNSPELLALAEQLRDDARHLAETYPARHGATREFARTRSRSPRRFAMALAAGLAAIGLTLWSVSAWRSVPKLHGPVVERGQVLAAAEAGSPLGSSLGASAAGVVIVPVASVEEVEELTVPEREAVFDLLEGDESEVAYLSI